MTFSDARRKYNLSKGLAEFWEPKMHFGPPNGKADFTPGGIRAKNTNWLKDKWPLEAKGQRVRQDWALVDGVWHRVQQDYSTGNLFLGAKLKVIFKPSIWWSDPHGFYVGGLQEGFQLSVCLWYESVLEPGRVSSWYGTNGRDGYLYHEMKHVVCGPFEEAQVEVIP